MTHRVLFNNGMTVNHKFMCNRCVILVFIKRNINIATSLCVLFVSSYIRLATGLSLCCIFFKTKTMEFPHIGKNCSYKSCNKLDFLPMKCGACKDVFCAEHFAYVKHDCPEPNTRDVQVPVCPLCGAPVPGRRGEPPDVAVGAHIDNQCTSDPARERRSKVFTNKCSYKGCKTKEMVALVCGECSLNYCLRHRHTTDHACEGKLAAKRRQAAAAAMARLKAAESRITSSSAVTAPAGNFSEIQGNMTEDEALAHALALSLQEDASIQDRDTNFARALLRQRVGGEQNSRCTVT